MYNDRIFNWVCFASSITNVKNISHSHIYVYRDANSFVRTIEMISFGDSFQGLNTYLCAFSTKRVEQVLDTDDILFT